MGIDLALLQRRSLQRKNGCYMIAPSGGRPHLQGPLYFSTPLPRPLPLFPMHRLTIHHVLHRCMPALWQCNTAGTFAIHANILICNCTLKMIRLHTTRESLCRMLLHKRESSKCCEVYCSRLHLQGGLACSQDWSCLAYRRGHEVPTADTSGGPRCSSCVEPRARGARFSKMLAPIHGT